MFNNYNIFNNVYDINPIFEKEVYNLIKKENFYESANAIIDYLNSNERLRNRLSQRINIGLVKLKKNGVENIFEFNIRDIIMEEVGYLEFTLINITLIKVSKEAKVK